MRRMGVSPVKGDAEVGDGVVDDGVVDDAVADAPADPEVGADFSASDESESMSVFPSTPVFPVFQVFPGFPAFPEASLEVPFLASAPALALVSAPIPELALVPAAVSLAV